jgi:hypothetical protein
MDAETFRKRTRQNLLRTWDYIGYDVIQLEEENEGPGATLTGADLRYIIPDHLYNNNDPEWYEAWEALTREEKDDAFFAVFPKNSRHGM